MNKKDKIATELEIALGFARSIFNKSLRLVKENENNVVEIFISNNGTPAGLVSIPNRYMHSPVEVVDLYDVDSAVELIVKWCEAVEPEHDWK